MSKEPEETLAGRFALSCFGALTGTVYGALVALVVFFATERGYPNIISWSAAVFAVLGYFYGNFIVEAFIAITFFVWGLLFALSHQSVLIEQTDSKGLFRAFLLLGFGTGLILLLGMYI